MGAAVSLVWGLTRPERRKESREVALWPAGPGERRVKHVGCRVRGCKWEP